jgi:HSP20 family protein
VAISTLDPRRFDAILIASTRNAIHQQEDFEMAESATKVPVKNEKKTEPGLQVWRPFDAFRREIDRLFEEFEGGFWGLPSRRSMIGMQPFWNREESWAAPAVDVSESDKAYEITAELPGLAEKDIEVKVANGGLTIKGEKQEEKEEKRRDYHLSERRYGAFQRAFRLPEGVDPEKIEASFRNGVLTVTLPKSAEAQKAEKKIAVKAG